MSSGILEELKEFIILTNYIVIALLSQSTSVKFSWFYVPGNLAYMALLSQSTRQ